VKNFDASRFSELADFNGDSDKSKYNDAYLEKMRLMQADYEASLRVYAAANNYLIFEVSSSELNQRKRNLNIARAAERMALGVPCFSSEGVH